MRHLSPNENNAFTSLKNTHRHAKLEFCMSYEHCITEHVDVTDLVTDPKPKDEII